MANIFNSLKITLLKITIALILCLKINIFMVWMAEN